MRYKTLTPPSSLGPSSPPAAAHPYCVPSHPRPPLSQRHQRQLTAWGGEGKQWQPMEVGTGWRTSTTTSSRWCSSVTPASVSPTSARRPLASSQPLATVASCRGHTRPLLSLPAALTGVLDGAPRSGRPRPQVALPLESRPLRLHQPRNRPPPVTSLQFVFG